MGWILPALVPSWFFVSPCRGLLLMLLCMCRLVYAPQRTKWWWRINDTACDDRRCVLILLYSSLAILCSRRWEGKLELLLLYWTEQPQTEKWKLLLVSTPVAGTLFCFRIVPCRYIASGCHGSWCCLVLCVTRTLLWRIISGTEAGREEHIAWMNIGTRGEYEIQMDEDRERKTVRECLAGEL